MKRSYGFLRIMFAILVLIAVLFAAAETFIVKLRTTNLKKDPKFYAQTLSVLKVGESVQKLQDYGAWIQVKNSRGAVGWIHSSSVENRKFSLLAADGSMKSQASASEVALAGKGFNKQVERSYKARNPNANYAGVDEMLKISVSISKIRAFLQRGLLGEYRRSK